MQKLLVGILVLSVGALAQETANEKRWSTEAEASVVQVGGNITSESYSAKQKTSYKLESNVLAITGRYLQTRAGGVETAKQWEAAARYERELGNNWAAFIQHGAESDTFAGYIQRDYTDIGGKYYFIKTEMNTFFTEAGFRAMKTLRSLPAGATTPKVANENSGRLYLEYATQMNEAVSAKLWAEYLPNFEVTNAYLLNYEPSVSVMMSQIFSIKLAYLVKYNYGTVPAGKKNEDSIFTTALVAKF